MKIQIIISVLFLSLCATAQQTTSSYNTPYGAGSLTSITSGRFNSGFGRNTLRDNTTGEYNSAVGNNTLLLNVSGSYNSAFGAQALFLNIAGNKNTGIGGYSIFRNTDGSNNTAVGYFSLSVNETGSENSVLGSLADVDSASAINRTVIGFGAIGKQDNSVVLGNADVTAVYMSEDAGATVYAGPGNFDGDLTVYGDAYVLSDARLKSNIVSLGSTLSKLLLIDGKTYNLKDNCQQKIGVLAQDIQKVFPELVSETDNRMLAVNYQGLVPVLINAFKEQQAQINELKESVSQIIDSE